MKLAPLITLSLTLLFLSLLSSCYELQSDEELRKDIIGTWKKVDCKLPYNQEAKEVTEDSPLRYVLSFYTDGKMSESGYCSYCSLDTCTSCWPNSDCGCQWVIQEGNLIIVPNLPYVPLWLNQQFPISCLKGDRLVFDNATINGQTFKKVCYEKN